MCACWYETDSVPASAGLYLNVVARGFVSRSIVVYVGWVANSM